MATSFICFYKNQNFGNTINNIGHVTVIRLTCSLHSDVCWFNFSWVICNTVCKEAIFSLCSCDAPSKNAKCTPLIMQTWLGNRMFKIYYNIWVLLSVFWFRVSLCSSRLSEYWFHMSCAINEKSIINSYNDYPVQNTEINDREGSAALTTWHPSIHKSWH
jgi:hypothetical protein